MTRVLKVFVHSGSHEQQIFLNACCVMDNVYHDAHKKDRMNVCAGRVRQQGMALLQAVGK